MGIRSLPILTNFRRERDKRARVSFHLAVHRQRGWAGGGGGATGKGSVELRANEFATPLFFLLFFCLPPPPFFFERSFSEHTIPGVSLRCR